MVNFSVNIRVPPRPLRETIILLIAQPTLRAKGTNKQPTSKARITGLAMNTIRSTMIEHVHKHNKRRIVALLKLLDWSHPASTASGCKGKRSMVHATKQCQPICFIACYVPQKCPDSNRTGSYSASTCNEQLNVNAF